MVPSVAIETLDGISVPDAGEVHGGLRRRFSCDVARKQTAQLDRHGLTIGSCHVQIQDGIRSDEQPFCDLDTDPGVMAPTHFATLFDLRADAAVELDPSDEAISIPKDDRTPVALRQHPHEHARDDERLPSIAGQRRRPWRR